MIEQYHTFKHGRRWLLQYKCELTNGDEFHTVSRSLKECRAKRNAWMAAKGYSFLPDAEILRSEGNLCSTTYADGDHIVVYEYLGDYYALVNGAKVERRASE